MPDLLLHSMAEFAGIILPALELAGSRTVVEVGSEYGTMTRLLLEHAERADGEVAVIDPKPAPRAEAMLRDEKRARLLRSLSLEALSGIDGDAFLIDGDHNYYTVLNESRIIWDRSRSDGKPFLAFYHDVGWPWGRRDLYYDPESVPEPFRRPHTWELGVLPGRTRAGEGGFRGEGNWACALEEGGPRNGVLTAIEDFVEGKEEHLVWACVPAVFGLGVLFERTAPWADALGALLAPFHMNPLLARMEENRLACYLTVIEWQDRAHAQCA